MDPEKLDNLKQWLLESDDAHLRRSSFATGTSCSRSSGQQREDRFASRRVGCRKPSARQCWHCSERSQQGLTPRKMTFDDQALDFIPGISIERPAQGPHHGQAAPDHTSGLCPEAIGAPNEGTWE